MGVKYETFTAHDISMTISVIVVLLLLAFSVQRGIEFRRNGGVRGWVVGVAKEIIEIHHEIEKEDQ